MSLAETYRGMGGFLRIWAAQLVSALGASLGGFSLGVWMFEQHHSTTQFALMTFTGAVTSLVVGPVGGWTADRWDRRRLLMVVNLVAALITAFMIYLLYTHRMQPWHVYPLIALLVANGSLEVPALQASITQLVPPEQLARANGMMQSSSALAAILAPPLAGALLSVIGSHGLLSIDCVSFLLVIAVLWTTPIPSPSSGKAAQVSLRSGMAEGWRAIRAQQGLTSLLVLLAFTTLSFGIVQVLLTPLVLGFSSPRGLGTVNSLGAAGALSGALLLSVWGGPRSKVKGILGALLLQGCILLLGGLRPSVTLIAFATFVFMFALPIGNGSNQAIWQRKIDPAIQGRVFGIRQMVISGAIPFAALAAGPLADRVFEPLLARGGPLAPTFGRVLGVGPGRGVGLLLMVLGFVVISATVIAGFHPRLRRVESEENESPEPASASPVDEVASLPGV